MKNSPTYPNGLSRRDFLKLGGIGVAGVIFVPLINGCESHTVTPNVEAAKTPFLTPRGEFFVQNGGLGSIEGWTQPSFPGKESWQMTIKNGGTTLGTITWNDLMTAAAEEEITILKTMQCILESSVSTTTTGLTGNAYWTGVPLKRFLDQVGLDYASPTTRIRRILVSGADTFFNNVTPERIIRSEEMGLVQPLLCYRMNGEDIPPEHGFPVRLIVQETFGYKNVKWMKEVQAITFNDVQGTYQEEGYVDDAEMRVTSRSTSIRDRVSVPSGQVEIRGFALSGYAPIEKVEITIDGVTANAEIIPLAEIQDEAALPPSILQINDDRPYPFKAVWTPWRYLWEAVPGEHTVAIRAFDQAGNVQPDADGDIYDGQNGVTRYVVTV